MKIISAYLLAALGGNESPSAKDVKKILSSVGIELNDDESGRLDALVANMKGKNLYETIAAGQAQIASVPSGGGGGGGGSAAAAAPAAAAGKDDKKGGKAKEPEPEPEEDDGAVSILVFFCVCYVYSWSSTTCVDRILMAFFCFDVGPCSPGLW